MDCPVRDGDTLQFYSMPTGTRQKVTAFYDRVGKNLLDFFFVLGECDLGWLGSIESNFCFDIIEVSK